MPDNLNSPDLQSILNKEIKLSLPRIHPLMKKFIAGYLTIFTLLVGTLVGLQLMGEDTDFRRAASTNNVDLSLNAPGSVSPGQQFTVSVIVTRTNNRPVSAADVRLNYPSNLLRLDSINKGSFFTTTNMQRPAPTNTYGWDNIGMELYKDTATAGTGRYALGALCDYCWLGATCTNPPEYPNACSILPACGNITPTCYTKSAITPGQNTLATYTFTALAAGTANLTLNNTEVSATNSDTNVAGDLTGTTLTIASDAPTPTPSLDLCGGADISADGVTYGQDGRVSAADYNYMMTKWTGSFGTCQ